MARRLWQYPHQLSWRSALFSMYQTEGTKLGSEGGSGTGFSTEYFDVNSIKESVLKRTSLGSTLGGMLW